MLWDVSEPVSVQMEKTRENVGRQEEVGKQEYKKGHLLALNRKQR